MTDSQLEGEFNPSPVEANAAQQPRLYTIPAEVWNEIMEFLCIDTRFPTDPPGLPLPITCDICGYTRQDGIYCLNPACPRHPPYSLDRGRPRLGDGGAWLAPRKAALQTLLNLYLVSKPVARAMEPFLYRTISITSGRGLARVAALLENKPHIGAELVTRIECLVDTRSQRVIEDWYFLQKNLEHGAPVVGAMKLMDIKQSIPTTAAGQGGGAQGASSSGGGGSKPKTKRRRGHGGRGKQPAAQRPVATVSWQGVRERPKDIVHVLAGLFLLAPRVNHLSSCLWACPRLVLDIPPYTFPGYRARDVHPPHMISLPKPPPPTTLLDPPFSHLKHLEFGTGGEACQILDHLHRFPQLETLKVWMFGGGFHGFNSTLKSSSTCESPTEKFINTPDGTLPHLKHITLDWLSITEGTLAQLCLACTNLETLIIRFAGSASKDSANYLSQASLNEALLQRKSTLKCLEMISLPLYGHFLTPRAPPTTNPRESRMTCLPGLTNLQQLSMHYVGLFGCVSRIDAGEVEAELPSRIPYESLNHLEIVCDRPWELNIGAWPAENNANSVMAGLEALHRRGLLPRELRYLSVAMDARGRLVETSRRHPLTLQDWPGGSDTMPSFLSCEAAVW
ncbi:hypothetical protein B0T19DRAFT_482816 [Cercophora scortea]|uniref:Uncharacterized protein n=1 Tax=Cercophora scortea TaxID=314031 RepID=A0AAE0MH95_9PEZI|nr:hypothetical protein B0T19DRAFT_482816 [Cercophora scortea]